MNKTPIAVALERQIPEHIREEYALFVDFIKAYYAFLEQTQQRDLEDIRSIDKTLDEFIIRFKKELSVLFPTTGLEDERFILQRLREFYKSRGSKESYQFLFRAFFNRSAEIQYPSTQILRASDGKWEQEKSIFVEAYSGNELFELAGKIIKLKTSKKHIDVYCPRVKYYRAGIYEVFIDRAYTSDISIDDIVSYNDIDVGTINPVPAKYTIVRPGSGFEVGKLYNLPSESGDGSIIKITKIDSNGGIKKIQIISFGLDYETTFFAKLSNTYYQPLEYFHPVSSATIGAGHPAGLWPTSTFDRGVVDEEGNLTNPTNPEAYGDTSLGYIEFGYINRNDYFLYQADYKGSNNILDITESNPDNEANPYFADGTYVGEIIASFYTNASNSVVIDETLAEIQVDLGAVAIYPGYYSSSDGFISDEIYIQDGKYYQLFSYVLKVEEQLDTYSELIKSLLHPAGFELFAQYNIKNEFLVSAVPLEAFVRYQYFERRFARDTSYWAMHKDIANFTNPTIDNFKDRVQGSADKYHLDRTGIDETTQPYDTYRNLEQPGIHLNKWDIAMGDANNPLEASTYTVIGNFENRTLGDPDTMQWSRTLGDFIDSVVETVTGRAIVKGVSTEAPMEAATATAVHSPGFDWAFAGETWLDVTGSVADIRASTENPSVWGLGKSDTQSVGDFFDRSDASSSTITYDRSIIPLANDVTGTGDALPLRAFTKPVADTTGTLTDSYGYTWAKFKQPIMGVYTATLTQGSSDVILTGANGVVFNTFAGLAVNKVSGTGAFGAGATVDTVFVTPNNKFTTSVPHATSGTITFTVSSSDTDGVTDFNADLNGYVTAAQSNGINWELGSISSPNPVFIQTASSVDNIPRDNIVVPYDRSTIPLEQTSVTAYSVGLGWDLTGFERFSDRQTANPNDVVAQRDITQTYTAETVSTAQGGMNWSFTTDAVTGFPSSAFSDRVGWSYNYGNPSAPYVTGNSGGAAASDITINFPSDGSALSNAFAKVAVGNTPTDVNQAFIMDLIRTPIAITTTGGTQVISSYGDLNNTGDVSASDALAILKHVNGTNTDPNVTSNSNRFLQLLRRSTSGFTIAGHDAMVAAGYYTYTINNNKDITRTLGDNINISNPGTLYYNPYNINTDATSVSSYNGGGTYFALDTRAI